MSPVLPFDIIELIINIVGENEDTDLLKELALVSNSFLQICRKHLFAYVRLYDSYSYVRGTKKGFIKLLESRPDAVNYISTLMYEVSDNMNNDDDHLFPPILLNFLPTFSRLASLTIIARRDWNTLDISLTSAFLHLMHLPTMNHIDLSHIQNFPLSSLIPSVNLLRLDMYMCSSSLLREDDYHEVVVEIMPKIREFRTSSSSLLTTRLLHAKTQDGRPAFNFMALRRVSMSFEDFEGEQNIRYLLQNAKLLEKLDLSSYGGRSLVGLLTLSAHTLKILDLYVPLCRDSVFLGGICEELEAWAGHDMLEALSIEVIVTRLDTEDFIASIFQKVENVLVKPGWPSLRQVTFIHPVKRSNGPKLLKAQQSLLDKYLSRLSKLESVAFNYSIYFV